MQFNAFVAISRIDLSAAINVLGGESIDSIPFAEVARLVCAKHAPKNAIKWISCSDEQYSAWKRCLEKMRIGCALHYANTGRE